jgi:hypothetical protein
VEGGEVVDGSVLVVGEDVDVLSGTVVVVAGSVVEVDVVAGSVDVEAIVEVDVEVDVVSTTVEVVVLDVVVGWVVEVVLVVLVVVDVEVVVDVVVSCVRPLQMWAWLMSYCWLATLKIWPGVTGAKVMWVPPPGPPTFKITPVTVQPLGGVGTVKVLPESGSTL